MLTSKVTLEETVDQQFLHQCSPLRRVTVHLWKVKPLIDILRMTRALDITSSKRWRSYQCQSNIYRNIPILQPSTSKVESEIEKYLPQNFHSSTSTGFQFLPLPVRSWARGHSLMYMMLLCRSFCLCVEASWQVGRSSCSYKFA